MLDRTPVSATYGCFDRSYWHYRIMDFPCGMSQEFVWPLALVWSLDLPGNPYRGRPAMRDWIEAGIRFATRSAHRDGSCDDYYPFERATGAGAFSLLAMLEASHIIGLGEDDEINRFFDRRATWLTARQESGALANHEALIVACLMRMAERGSNAWEPALAARFDRLLSWQSKEGWFSEYGGADLGYLSLTIGLLADIDRRRPHIRVREPLARAIRFLSDFVHPDGTIGGEYTSRGTLNFFPHGFEIAGAWMPEALAVNERALRPLRDGHAPCYSDDRIIGHHVWSWLLAWQYFRSERPVPVLRPPGRVWYDEARLLIDRRGSNALFVALGKGGALKLFQDDRLAHSDTGPTLLMKGGRVAVTHLEVDNKIIVHGDELVVEGQMAWAREAKLTPLKTIMLRTVMLIAGRFCPDLMRRLLQRLLVTGRTNAPFRFRRELLWNGVAWSIKDTIWAERGWADVAKAGVDGFQTSITTVMARVFDLNQLQPWLDLTSRLQSLRYDEPLVIEQDMRHDGNSL
ncbi:hypothetical protein [Methyloceanibacter sp.]|uniref:hypothetical protein n=1 Tax=Methyloceanibacter sp. TaxID=1965321 RepID=UPI003D6D8BB9